MNFHFKILLRTFLRKVESDGMHPFVVLCVMLTMVIGSILLVHAYAPMPNWVIAGFSLLVLIAYKQARNDKFMLAFWSKIERFALRSLEYLVISSPFLIYLIVTISFIQVSLLLLIIILLAYVDWSKSNGRVIPSPFRSRPFEFGAGFRRTFLIYPFVIFLLAKGIEVDNFNLSLLSIVLLVGLLMMNYNRPEDGAFLEAFSKNPSRVLRHKLLDVTYNSTLVLIIPVITIGYCFPTEIIYLAIVVLLAYAYLTLMIFVKYSAFPLKMSISQAVLLSFTIWFPPLVLVFIFIFRKKALSNLSSTTYDKS